MAWHLDITLTKFVALEANIHERAAEKLVVAILAKDELAYVARYNANINKELSLPQIRDGYEAYNEAMQLNTNVGKAIVAIEKNSELPDKVKKVAIGELRAAREANDVADVKTRYAKSKKLSTLAKALSFGLGLIADEILQCKEVDIKRFVDRKEPDMDSFEKVTAHLNFLMADKLNKMDETVEMSRKIALLEEPKVKLTIISTAKRGAEAQILQEYNSSIGIKIPASRITNNRIMALSRGEEAKALSWHVDVENAEWLHPGKKIRVASGHIKLFQNALSYSIVNMFIPKIKRTIKTVLTKKAMKASINVFTQNLAQLFLQNGLKGRNVLALDPGYNNCKYAMLDYNGCVVANGSIAFSNGFTDKGQQELIKVANKKRPVIAIGNGAATLETQKAIQGMIEKKMFEPDVKFCVVSEAGASKYSITPLADEEFPNMHVTQRSAVSIGRRLIDPVSEFCKIEPKHLGIGQYQHSVSEKKLAEELDKTVSESVSFRGVDLNSAGSYLLCHVCGLNKKTAEAIVSYRIEKGRIESREEIKKIKGIGPKTFEQTAGFLIVRPPNTENSDGPSSSKRRKKDYNPLDATTVHPEKYEIAERILKNVGVDKEEIGMEHARKKLMQYKTEDPDEKQVIGLLTTVLELISPPPLLTKIRNISSVKVGERREGRVTNHTQFGIFIDIETGKDALAHEKNLVKPWPLIGTQVQVKIREVKSDGKIGVELC